MLASFSHSVRVRPPQCCCVPCCVDVLCSLLRVRELLAARMLVEKLLPFSFFSSGTTWKELIATAVSADDTPFPALTSRRIKHLLVEMFVATKKVGDFVRPPRSLFSVYFVSEASALLLSFSSPPSHPLSLSLFTVISLCRYERNVY